MRGLIPASLREKYLCAAPSRHLVAQPSPVAHLFPVRTSGSRRLFELLLLAKQAVFETATSPVFTRVLSWVEVTRTFTTPEFFAEGTFGSSTLLCQLPEQQQLSLPAGFEPAIVHEVTRPCATLQTLAAGIAGSSRIANRCSTTELRQLSPLAGIEPATVGLVEVTQAFTTQQTFQFFSLPPYFVTSFLLSPDTPVASLHKVHFHPSHRSEKIPGGISRSREIALRTRRELCSPRDLRSNRELHHPGTPIPRRMQLDRNDLGGLF
jgi:hypothetical protein